MMLFLCLFIFYLASQVPTESRVIPFQKRSAFYIANQTACVVDGRVYYNGDNIPTDNPCESCRCRPPGFSCVLHECEIKHGCKAIRREGECCPEYLCGCEHNGQLYRNGEEIKDPQNPCYKCHCQGNSIVCAFLDCIFRRDCPPKFVSGECCPYYSHCRPSVDTFKVSTALPQWNVTSFINTSMSTVQSTGTDAATILPTTTTYKDDISKEFISDTASSEIKPIDDSSHAYDDENELVLPDVTTEPSEIKSTVDIKHKTDAATSLDPNEESEGNEKETESPEDEEIIGTERKPEFSSESSDEENSSTHETETSLEEHTSEFTTEGSITVEDAGQLEKSTTLQETKIRLPEARSTQSSAEVMEEKVEDVSDEETSSSEEVSPKDDETEEDVSSEEDDDDDEISDERRQEDESEEEASTEEQSTEESSEEELEEEHGPSHSKGTKPAQASSSDDFPSNTDEETSQLSLSTVSEITYEYATHRDDSIDPSNVPTDTPLESTQHNTAKQETVSIIENNLEFTSQLPLIETTAGKSELELQKENQVPASSESPMSTADKIVTMRMEEGPSSELTTTDQTADQTKPQATESDKATTRMIEFNEKNLTDTSEQAVTLATYEDLIKSTAETGKTENNVVELDHSSIPSSTFTETTITEYPETTETEQAMPKQNATTLSELPIENTMTVTTVTTPTSAKEINEITSLTQQNTETNKPEEEKITTEIKHTTVNMEMETIDKVTALVKENTPLGTTQEIEVFTSRPHVKEGTTYRQYFTDKVTTKEETFEDYLQKKSTTETIIPNGQITEEITHLKTDTEDFTKQEQIISTESSIRQSNENSIPNEQDVHTIDPVTITFVDDNHDESQFSDTTIHFEQDFIKENANKEQTTVGSTLELSTVDSIAENENQDRKHTTEKILVTDHPFRETDAAKFTETDFPRDESKKGTHEQTTKYLDPLDTTLSEKLTSITISDYAESTTFHPARITETATPPADSLSSAVSTFEGTEKDSTETMLSIIVNNATEISTSTHLETRPKNGSFETASMDHVTTTTSLPEKTTSPIQTSTSNTKQETHDLDETTIINLFTEKELQKVSTENDITQSKSNHDTDHNASIVTEAFTGESTALNREGITDSSQFLTELFSTVKPVDDGTSEDSVITIPQEKIGNDISTSHQTVLNETTDSPNRSYAATQTMLSDEFSTVISLKDTETTAGHVDDATTKQNSKKPEGVTDLTLDGTSYNEEESKTDSLENNNPKDGRQISTTRFSHNTHSTSRNQGNAKHSILHSMGEITRETYIQVKFR